MTSEQQFAVTSVASNVKSLFRGNSVATLNQIYQHHNSIPVRNRILNTAKSLQQPSLDLADDYTESKDEYLSPLSGGVGFGSARNSSGQLSNATYSSQLPQQRLSHLQVSPVHNNNRQQASRRSGTPSLPVVTGTANLLAGLTGTQSSATAHQLVGVQVINVARRHKKRPNSAAAELTESYGESQQPHLEQVLPTTSDLTCTPSSQEKLAGSFDLREATASIGRDHPPERSSPPASPRPSALNKSPTVQQPRCYPDNRGGLSGLHAHYPTSGSRSPSPARSPQEVEWTQQQQQQQEQQPAASRRRVLPPPPPPPSSAALQQQQVQQSEQHLEPNSSEGGGESLAQPPLQANWKRHRKLPQIPADAQKNSHQLHHPNFTSLISSQHIDNTSNTFSSSADQQQPLRLQSFPLAASADGTGPFGQQQLQPTRPSLARVSSHTATAAAGNRPSFSSSSSSNSPASTSNTTGYLLAQQQSRFTFEPPTPTGNQSHHLLTHEATSGMAAPSSPNAFLCPSSSPAFAQLCAPSSPPAHHLSTSSRTLSPNSQEQQHQEALGGIGAGRGRRLSSCGLGSRASFLMNKQRAISEFTPPRSLESSNSRGSGDMILDTGRCGGSAQSIGTSACNRAISTRTSYSQQSPNWVQQAGLTGQQYNQLPLGYAGLSVSSGPIQRRTSGAISGLPPRAASATETNSRGGLGQALSAGAPSSGRPVNAARSMTTMVPMMMMGGNLNSSLATTTSFNYKQRLVAPDRCPIGAAISIDVYQPDQITVSTSPEMSPHRQQYPHPSECPTNSGSAELDQSASCLVVADRTGRQSLALPARDRQPSNVSTSSMPAGVGAAQGSASCESSPRKFGAWAERFGSNGRSPERPANGLTVSPGSATPNVGWSRSASQLAGTMSAERRQTPRDPQEILVTRNHRKNSQADSSSSSSCARSSSSLTSSPVTSSSPSHSSSSSSSSASLGTDELAGISPTGTARRSSGLLTERGVSSQQRHQKRRRRRGCDRSGQRAADQLTLGDKLKLAERSAQRLFRKVELSPAGSRQLSGSKQTSNESTSPYSLACGTGSSFQFSGGPTSTKPGGTSGGPHPLQQQPNLHHNQYTSANFSATTAKPQAASSIPNSNSDTNCEQGTHEFAHDEQADDLSLFLRSVDKQKLRELRMMGSGAAKLSSSQAQQQQPSQRVSICERDKTRPGESTKGVAARAFKRAITLRRLVSSFGRRASSCEPAALAPSVTSSSTRGGAAEIIADIKAPASPPAHSKRSCPALAGKRRSSSADQSPRTSDTPVSERASRLNRMRSVITAVSKRLEPLRGMNGARRQQEPSDCSATRKCNANSQPQPQPQQQFSAAATRRKLSSFENQQQNHPRQQQQQQWTHLVDRTKA